MNEAELLFSEVLKCDRAGLYLDQARKLSPRDAELIAAALKRRLSGEPLQYILGKCEFMDLEFKLTPDVLIPRQETELLVEKTIDLASCVMRRASCVKILDLGTGSGCIAVSLAKFLPDAEITATDISEKALEVAEYNAELNGINKRIIFTQSDLFSCNAQRKTHNAQRKTQYDIIVSNPPYIRSAEIKELQPEVRREPRIALDGGPDGLEFYRRIIPRAARYLKQGGFLIMEMGFGQSVEVKKTFQRSGFFEIIEIIQDYNRIDRIIVARNARRKTHNAKLTHG